MKSLICVIKLLELHPLNRDLLVEMRPRVFHQSRYNSFKYGVCADVIRGTLSPHDRRVVFKHAVDPTPCVNPHHLCIKYRVELSPTQRKLKKTIRFITCDEYEGLASSKYGMLICTITLSNKYIFSKRHIASHRRHVGLRGAATWP